MPVAREEREKEKKGLDISNGTRCALWRELGILRYLLGSWEGVVEARNIGHDGFLVRTGSSNNVCQKKPHVKSIITWWEESRGGVEPQLSRRPAAACHSDSTGLPSTPHKMCVSQNPGSPFSFPSIIKFPPESGQGKAATYQHVLCHSSQSWEHYCDWGDWINPNWHQTDMTFIDISYCNSSMQICSSGKILSPFFSMSPSSISTQRWLEFQEALSLVSGETQHLQRSELMVWRNAH